MGLEKELGKEPAGLPLASCLNRIAKNRSNHHLGWKFLHKKLVLAGLISCIRLASLQSAKQIH